MRHVLLLAAVFGCWPLAANAQDNPPPSDSAPPAAPGPAANPPMQGPQILISTAMGDIALQLDAVRAPKSTANILRYVREKHYDGTVFYRVVKGFIVQMGSFDANGKGRPGHPPIVFEGNNGLSNLRGTAALGHGEDPNTAAADFFINVADNKPLDHVEGNPEKMGYAVFGQVISGMDVADAINAVPLGDHGPFPGQAPIDPILIKSVTVLPSQDWHAGCKAGSIPAFACEAAMLPAAAKAPAAKAAPKPPGSTSRRSGR